MGNDGTTTPLLVPSFSSTAFPRAAEVRTAMNLVKTHLAVSSLISAYDIHQGYLDKEVGGSDLVIIDSGNYEKSTIEGQGYPVKWTREDHKTTIGTVIPRSQVAIVNYDEPGEIAAQAEDAHSFFQEYPRYSTDFLCKPLKGSTYVDVGQIGKNLDSILKFDVLGLTEKELGHSVLERCTNVAKLRRLLDSAGYDTPIHVFGCFEPMTVVLMCLCGADIFDGLTWTKFAVQGDSLVYTGSIPFEEGTWSTDENTIRLDAASRHLSRMTDLMLGLRSFARSHDHSALGLQNANVDLAKAITAQVAEKLG